MTPAPISPRRIVIAYLPDPQLPALSLRKGGIPPPTIYHHEPFKLPLCTDPHGRFKKVRSQVQQPGRDAVISSGAALLVADIDYHMGYDDDVVLLPAPSEEFTMQWMCKTKVTAAILFSFVFYPCSAWAERQCNVPAGYYRLVDREDDGAVEFRAQPSHKAALLEALHPGDVIQSDGTRNVDIDHAGTTWQQVTILQTSGWVPARKLWRTLPLTLGKSEVPAIGRCGDSTSLWSMSWTSEKVRLSLYPGRYELPISLITTSDNSAGALIAGSGSGITYRLVYENDVCRDIRGDMVGIGKASLIVERDGAVQLYSGCCTAARDSFVHSANALEAPP